MQQAWHIFKKDIRFLYREIPFLLILAVVGALMPEGDAADMLMIYATAVAFTVARLVQAEAIPGQNQFWITRPYRWSSLLAAKFIFLFAFVHLPVLIAQSAILIHEGFSPLAFLPGVLWTQVLLLLAISVPSLALAALTTGLVPFIATILLLLAIGFVAGRPNFSFQRYTPEAFDWVRYSIPFLLAALALPPVLYFQYRQRTTRSSTIAAATALLIGAMIFAWLPWNSLFAVQTLLSRRSIDVKLTPDPDNPTALTPLPGGPVEISVPLVVADVPSGIRPQPETFDLELRRADGRALRFEYDRLGLNHPVRNMAGIPAGPGMDPNKIRLSGSFYPDPASLQEMRTRHFTVRVTLYFTLFGNRRARTIPFVTRPVPALDSLQCLDYFQDVFCRAPLRWPGLLVSAKAPWYGASTFTHFISYSPFPANLRLDPIVERSAGPHYTKDTSVAHDITIESEEPLAYVRRDIEIYDVALGRK